MDRLPRGYGNSLKMDNGRFRVKGNVSAINAGLFGSAVIELIAESGTQVLSGDLDAWLPSIEINAPSADIVIDGHIKTQSYEVLNAQTLVAEDSHVQIDCISDSNFQCFNWSGNRSLNFGNYDYHDLTITPFGVSYDFGGSTVRVDRNFAIGHKSSFNPFFFRNGTVEVKGNVELIHLGVRADNFLVKLVGDSGTQTINSTATERFVPAVEIDAASVDVTLSGLLRFTGGYRALNASSITVASGAIVTIDCVFWAHSCRSSPLELQFLGETFNSFTLLSFSNVSLNSSTLRTTGTLSLGTGSSAGSPAAINDGILDVQENMVILNHGAIGTATVQFTGSGAQSLHPNGLNLPRGNFTVNKPSGTLTLLSAVNLNGAGQNLTISSGTVNMNGFNLAVNNTLTVDDGATLQRNGGAESAATIIGSHNIID